MAKHGDYKGLTKADRAWLERFDKNERGKFFDDGHDVMPIAQDDKRTVWRYDKRRRNDAMLRAAHEPSEAALGVDPSEDMIAFLDFSREMATAILESFRKVIEGDFPSPASMLLTAPEEPCENQPPSDPPRPSPKN